MNADKWIAEVDLRLMQDFLDQMGLASQRKLRLFACACCRSVWHLITDERNRKAIEVAEQFADNLATLESLREVHVIVEDSSRLAWRNMRTVVSNGQTQIGTKEDALAAAVPHLAASATQLECGQRYARDLGDATVQVVMWSATPPELWGTEAGDRAAEQAIDKEFLRHPQLFRCIFGYPFRPVSVNSDLLAWNDGTVPKIAQSIYDTRDFSLMPILADALEDAGCDNVDILTHCRQPGEHVRGCWVVDLLLGKS